ncbi:MAG: hypothetical protein Q4F27_03765 [Desulfovibrionaceae bacterium]|nr:hypothetical protein [Desulfovibrionaceae bacterium]
MNSEKQSPAPEQATSQSRWPKVPKLVWILLIWALGTWGLWIYVTRPEVPPLEEGLLSLAHNVRVDLTADAWGRDFQARLEDGGKKFTDPDHKDAHKVLFILEALRAGRLDAACATGRSIEGQAKRDEMLGTLVQRAAENCETLALGAWAATAMRGKDARIPVHELLNERWDDCPR